jgi:hypothetical protein
VVSGRSTAAAIHTAAIAAVQPMTERSEVEGVIVVVMWTKRPAVHGGIVSVADRTVGYTTPCGERDRRTADGRHAIRTMVLWSAYPLLLMVRIREAEHI